MNFCLLSFYARIIIDIKHVDGIESPFEMHVHHALHNPTFSKSFMITSDNHQVIQLE
jgi:hypothetical protein